MPNSTLKKFLFTKQGLTLTELLVASTLMGIVMIGVASYSLNTKQLHSSGGMANILAIRMTAIMKMIEEDAIMAIGDTTAYSGSSGSGIRTRPPGGGSRRKICFRHDVNKTPDRYNDDEWMCYCIRRTGPPILRQWPDGQPNGNSCPDNNDTRQLITLNDRDFFNVVPNHDSPEYVDITLDACYDPTVACHPIDNPQKIITTRVVPASHSQG